MIDGIDAINICTGLQPDDLLMTRGREVFGRQCHGAGDALRIGEGTSAVLRGRQAAFDILAEAGISYDYNEYLSLSGEYIDSQQHPLRVIDEPFLPSGERKTEKPFVMIDCLHGFACNPCEFACPHGAITKTSTGAVPHIDYSKCTGCMACVYQCPGLAIFGYNLKKDWLFLPLEFDVPEGEEVFLVGNDGSQRGSGIVEKILRKKNRTNLARVRSLDVHGDSLTEVRGFIRKTHYPEPLTWEQAPGDDRSETFLCHCEDVRIEDILKIAGDRTSVSVDEIKHTTRLGMGACRGKRCIQRLRQAIRPYGITLTGEATPRGPMSNPLSLGELYPSGKKDEIIVAVNGSGAVKKTVKSLVAGGGIGGSALFRYLAEAGLEPVLINDGHGSSWRNIAGGRPAFSVPELSDIARQNFYLFRELQSVRNIDFRKIRYVNFAHDEESYQNLEASMAWQDACMIGPDGFRKEISPLIGDLAGKYTGALITRDCWQATPGKTIEVLRNLGRAFGGSVKEGVKLMDVRKDGDTYIALTRNPDGTWTEYHTPVFVNALGAAGGEFARKAGYETGHFPVRHQAFITRRMPMMGVNGEPLPMLIDRRRYKGFIAVYGQQLAETGQIIGCASPAFDGQEAGSNLKTNSRRFAEIVSEVFVDWIPDLAAAGFQALWSGYYVEPRMIIDPAKGLFIGLRGQGFMLGQYLARLYVDDLLGKKVPEYFRRLSLEGDGLHEMALK